jgi:magnesium transporter
MVLFSEMFVSELIGKPVLDRFEDHIGNVKDILADFDQSFPKVSGLLIELPDMRQEKIVFLREIDLVGKRFISTRTVKDRVPYGNLGKDDLLLCRDIFEKQIMDTQGARVVRVNDIKLAKVDDEIRLIAVDVGISGLLRRLGLEPFVRAILGLFRIKMEQSLIGWNYVEFVRAEINKGKLTIPHKRVEELHPSDIASIISDLRSNDRTEIFENLPEKTAAEALHELAPKIQAYLLTTIDTKKALGVLNKMPVDEAADVLGDIPFERSEVLLRLMKKRKAGEIRKLLKHHDETAGGLMTTEMITLTLDQTVEQTINKLREMDPRAETIYYLYIVDAEGKFVGVVSLRDLIVSKPSTVLADIMTKDLKTVTPEANQRHVADVISKYNLLAVPVVNGDGKIQGIVTVDDVVDIMLPTLARRKKQVIS